MSYAAAKEEIADLVMSEFNKLSNPYKIMVLVDNLNLHFKKPKESDAIKGMIKCFAKFGEKEEGEFSGFLEKGKNQVFLDILTRLKAEFVFTKEIFPMLEREMSKGNIEDVTLIEVK